MLTGVYKPSNFAVITEPWNWTFSVCGFIIWRQLVRWDAFWRLPTQEVKISFVIFNVEQIVLSLFLVLLFVIIMVFLTKPGCVEIWWRRLMIDSPEVIFIRSLTVWSKLSWLLNQSIIEVVVHHFLLFLLVYWWLPKGSTLSIWIGCLIKLTHNNRFINLAQWWQSVEKVYLGAVVWCLYKLRNEPACPVISV